MVSACLEFAGFVYLGAAVGFEFSNFNPQWVVVDMIFVRHAFKRQIEVDYMMSGDYFIGLLITFLDFLGEVM